MVPTAGRPTRPPDLSTVYGKLPDTTARPAVAAALADVEDDADRAVARYETVRTELERLGSRLVNDRLEIEAIAALLLMNNSDGNVPQFASAYATNRDLGFPPDEAVEYALAGLTHRKEIERIRDRSDDLGIPVSITAALIRSRDDGVEVFEELLSELPVEEESTPATRRTIAAILAISLEPAQAVRRWTEARQMLGRLGLEGAYADIAAAFGASDPRGPRQFVLSYAATRQALANSDIDDADRFAPELAHEGTKYQTDTWTGQRLDPQSRHVRSVHDVVLPMGHHRRERRISRLGNQFSRTAPGRVIQILGSEALAAAAVSLAGAAADPGAEALGGAAVGSAAASAAVAVSAEAAAAAAGSPKRIINRRLGTCCDGSRYQPQRPGGDRHGRFIGHGKGLCHTARRGGCRCSDRWSR